VDLRLAKFNALLKSVKLPPGQLTLDDMFQLYYYSQDSPLSVELGTLQGLGAAILAINSDMVVTVDLFEDVESVDTPSREHYVSCLKTHPREYSVVSKYLAAFGNIQVIKNLSYLESSNFGTGSIHTLFVDADHSYEGVKKDLESYYQKVSRYFLLHDYYSGWPGVEEASVEFFLDKPVRFIEREFLHTSIQVVEKI